MLPDEANKQIQYPPSNLWRMGNGVTTTTNAISFQESKLLQLWSPASTFPCLLPSPLSAGSFHDSWCKHWASWWSFWKPTSWRKPLTATQYAHLILTDINIWGDSKQDRLPGEAGLLMFQYNWVLKIELGTLRLFVCFLVAIGTRNMVNGWVHNNSHYNSPFCAWYNHWKSPLPYMVSQDLLASFCCKTKRGGPNHFDNVTCLPEYPLLDNRASSNTHCFAFVCVLWTR